jgi:hypothetical protein
MLGIATHRAARIVAGLLTTIVLAGCAAHEADRAVDEPATEPIADPDPDGSDSDGGFVDEPRAPTHDWDDLQAEVALAGGWQLRDCAGDAPLRCLHNPDGSVRGTIEVLRFEEHDGLVGAYDVDRASAALDDLVDDFEVWLIDDRAAGCPQHTVELEPSEPASIDGAPAIIRGHRVLTHQGEAIERSLVAYIADGGDLVLVTVNATAPGGCTHVAELDELTPAEFDHLQEDLRRLLVYGSVPRG